MTKPTIWQRYGVLISIIVTMMLGGLAQYGIWNAWVARAETRISTLEAQQKKMEEQHDTVIRIEEALKYINKTVTKIEKQLSN